MNYIENTIKEFDEEFGEINEIELAIETYFGKGRKGHNCPICGSNPRIMIEDIKDFLTNLLKGLVEDLDGKIDGMMFVDTAQVGQFSMHADGYNQAIEEIKQLLSEYK